MSKISAYILSYNEAEKIEAAVSSVLWADEVVVVDSFSTDRTPEIARALGARVVNVAFNGFGDLRIDFRDGKFPSVRRHDGVLAWF